MTLWQELILLTKIAWPGVLSISVGISLSRLVPQVLIRHFSRPDLRRPVFVKGGTHASVPNGGSHHTTELRAVRKHANPSRASQPGRRPAAPQRARGREGVANPPRARSLQGDVATFPQALDRERMSLTLCRREAAGERVPPPPICGREAERGSRGPSQACDRQGFGVQPGLPVHEAEGGRCLCSSAGARPGKDPAPPPSAGARPREGVAVTPRAWGRQGS